MNIITINEKRFFVDNEITDGDELSAVRECAKGVSKLDKGILSNGWVTMHNGTRVKYNQNDFSKLSPVPLDYEYITQEDEHLFIGVTMSSNSYSYHEKKGHHVLAQGIHVLKASDMNHATAKFQNILMSEYFSVGCGCGTMSVKKAHIFKVSEYQILDLDAISDQWNKTIKENYDKEQLEKKREQYEALKKELEGSEDKQEVS